MPDTLEHAVAWAEEIRNIYLKSGRPNIIPTKLSKSSWFYNRGVDHRIDFNWEYLVDHQGNESPGCMSSWCEVSIRYGKAIKGLGRQSLMLYG